MTHFENVEIVMIFYISTKNLKQLCIMYVPVFIEVLTKVEKKKLQYILHCSQFHYYNTLEILLYHSQVSLLYFQQLKDGREVKP